MKLDSKYFDAIRIKPRRKKAQEEHPPCEWPGCDAPGGYPAPKGRGHEGQYFRFCLEHVREYNKTYNYFRGMSQAEAEAFRDSMMVGHRPTWVMGTNGAKRPVRHVDLNQWGLNGLRMAGRKGFTMASDGQAADFFDLFGTQTAPNDAPKGRRRALRPLERKSLGVLGLPETATAQEIKARFKQLVKRHHPDANGGEGSEEALREIIQAYNYLKQMGLC